MGENNRKPFENVTCTVSDNTLYIAIDLSAEGRLSETGKSTVIASTHGNSEVPGLDPSVRVGVNVFRLTPKAPKAAKAAKPQAGMDLAAAIKALVDAGILTKPSA